MTQTWIVASVAAALSVAAMPATAAPAAKSAQAAQVRTDDGATDFSARRYRRDWRYRQGYAAYPYAAPQPYYGYRGGYYAPAPYARGADPLYGTRYHGPNGPWAPACARGATC